MRADICQSALTRCVVQSELRRSQHVDVGDLNDQLLVALVVVLLVALLVPLALLLARRVALLVALVAEVSGQSLPKDLQRNHCYGDG